MAANETVLEERIKFIQADLGEVKTALQELRTADKALSDRFEKKTDDLAAGTQALRDRLDQRMDALDADNKALRDRLDQKTDALAAENKETRKEMAQGFAEVRKEMAQGFAEVRKEMTQGFEKVNGRVDEKTDVLTQGLGELSKEMAAMRGTVKATFRIVSVATSVITIAGILVGIGKALDWF